MAKKTEKNPKGAGAPEGNKNAEKWPKDKAIELLEKAVELSKEKEIEIISVFDELLEETTHHRTVKGYKYDFIGEVARDLDTYHHIFKMLADKFEECDKLRNQLLANLEANCFFNSKRGNIKEATAIVNLKANYRWKDRVDATTGDEPIKLPDLSGFNYDQLKELARGNTDSSEE